MSDETEEALQAPGLLSEEQAAEPRVLKLAEDILGSSDFKSVSEILDVASIFYTAVATIVGSLACACLYLWVHAFSPVNSALWVVFLLGTVIVGGAVGAAAVAIIFNARGYTRWQRKYRPDEIPRR